MNLEYGPEYNDFRQEVIGFVKQNEDIKLTGPVRSESRVAWQQKLIDNGYFARSIPKEYGGYGGDMDIIKLRIIAEEFAKSSIPKPMSGQGIQMLVPTLLELGTEEQKQAYVRPTLRGEMIWCQGYSEPNSGSDLASLQTKGELDGDEWVINGQKIWTSTAQLSQMCFILVRTEPDAPKHQGISYLLMPMDTPGIDRRPIKQMTGDSDFNELFLTDVRIPAENIIGQRGEGWKVANATLGHERGSLADPNATMNRFNSLVNLMKGETIDGERVIDKPVFRDRLLRIQGRIIAQQSNALRIVSSQINKGQDTNMARFITKLQGTELRHDLEGLAIDAMGEIGTLYEDSPHLRDQGAWQMSYMYFLGLIIGGGTSQIQKNIISERGLGMPKEPKVQGA
jgi:alkylation response protein AidB-like acyl-CoA dehydrogenase|tara:strand:- start:248 stop:1435 length:1188 start_codon:yes stop_codon:yes gene_type:complete